MARALLLASGRALFGLDIKEVREVLKAPPLHYVPLAPALVLGAINIHDAVVPVFDFSQLRGAQSEVGEHIVVLQGACMALAVNAVHGLCSRTIAMPGGIMHPWVRETFISVRGLAGLIDPVALQQTLEQRLSTTRSLPAERVSEWIAR